MLTKRVVIISASLQVRSHDDWLAEQFFKDAKSAGHQGARIPPQVTFKQELSIEAV